MTIRRCACSAVALLLIVLPPPFPAKAQGVDCQGLRARIDTLASVGARVGQFAAALRQQQYELQRTQSYSDSIGCNSNFLFNTGPATCDTIAARIERMQGNIDQLQQRLQGGGDDGYRRALTDQYQAYCAGVMPDPRTDDASQNPPMMPVDPDSPPVADDGPDDGDARPHRVRALCVRECDGGFFPITDDASSAMIDKFDHLCKALCPNAKASLYTAAPSAGIETAVAADGTPYTDLPAAFKFQKNFDATCSCKPPHQSWVEALAEAEKLIQSGQGDVTVTQTMSDAMSRPVLPGAAGQSSAAGKAAVRTKMMRKAKPSSPLGASPPDLADGGAAPAPDTFGGELTKQLRRDAPTL